MNTNEFDRLIRIKELKGLIGLSHASIYRHISNGNFQSLSIYLSDVLLGG
jgi:predicted DNA-binding transcriptional regulator AlpA